MISWIPQDIAKKRIIMKNRPDIHDICIISPAFDTAFSNHDFSFFLCSGVFTFSSFSISSRTMRSGRQFLCFRPRTFFPEPIASTFMSFLVRIPLLLQVFSPFRLPKSSIRSAFSSSSVLISSKNPSACSEESDNRRI